MPTPQVDLRAQIRRLLAMGVIAPRAKNQKVYGGRGDGQMCDCCHQPIDAHSIVYEVDSLDRPRLAMHLQCLEAWEAESNQYLAPTYD